MSDVPTLPAGTFADLVQNALNSAVTPERIAEKVNVHVERAVDEAVRDAMTSWSGTGKAVKAALEGSLAVRSLDLPSYGHVVSEIVIRQVEARVAEVVSAKLAADLTDLLNLAPKTIRLSKLIEELIGPEGSEEALASGVSCEVEWSDMERWAKVVIRAKDHDGWHDVDTTLHVLLPKPKKEFAGPFPKDGHPAEYPSGQISFGHVSGLDLKKDRPFGYGTDRKTFTLGRGFTFQQRVLALYACGTVIELDEDAVVTERD